MRLEELHARFEGDPAICACIAQLAGAHGWSRLVASWCAWNALEGRQIEAVDAQAAFDAVRRLERDVSSKLDGALVAAQALSRQPFSDPRQHEGAEQVAALIRAALTQSRLAQFAALEALGPRGSPRDGDLGALLSANFAAYSMATRCLALTRDVRARLSQAAAAAVSSAPPGAVAAGAAP